MSPVLPEHKFWALVLMSKTKLVRLWIIWLRMAVKMSNACCASTSLRLIKSTTAFQQPRLGAPYSMIRRNRPNCSRRFSTVWKLAKQSFMKVPANLTFSALTLKWLRCCLRTSSIWVRWKTTSLCWISNLSTSRWSAWTRFKSSVRALKWSRSALNSTKVTAANCCKLYSLIPQGLSRFWPIWSQTLSSSARRVPD